MSLKSGVSMGGTIEHTRSEKTRKFIRHIDSVKKKNAKVCLKCESNKEGFCEKHKGWCNKVNYICNGFEMSYQEKIQQNKNNLQSKNISVKYLADGELLQGRRFSAVDILHPAVE